MNFTSSEIPRSHEETSHKSEKISYPNGNIEIPSAAHGSKIYSQKFPPPKNHVLVRNKFECEVCGEGFTSENVFMKENEMICEKCKKVNLERQLADPGKCYPQNVPLNVLTCDAVGCDECGKIFASKDFLKLHKGRICYIFRKGFCMKKKSINSFDCSL